MKAFDCATKHYPESTSVDSQICKSNVGSYLTKLDCPANEALSSTCSLLSTTVEDSVSTTRSAFIDPLPKLCRVGKDEHESEDEFYSQSLRPYWYKDSTWKGAGSGEAKLLKHRRTGMVRFMFLHAQKTLENFSISNWQHSCEWRRMLGNDRTWELTVLDCRGDEPKETILALKFHTVEETAQFKEACDQAWLMS